MKHYLPSLGQFPILSGKTLQLMDSPKFRKSFSTNRTVHATWYCTSNKYSSTYNPISTAIMYVCWVRVKVFIFTWPSMCCTHAWCMMCKHSEYLGSLILSYVLGFFLIQHAVPSSNQSSPFQDYGNDSNLNNMSLLVVSNRKPFFFLPRIITYSSSNVQFVLVFLILPGWRATANVSTRVGSITDNSTITMFP
jgi:hypothetical protein